MHMRGVGGSMFGAIAIVLATPVSIESMRWWRSSRMVAELRLSPAQAAAIDGIYRTMGAQSAGCARGAAAERRRLDDALESDGADHAFEIATSRLADTESACRRMRTLMLYRMFRELSVEQRQTLSAIAARPRAYAQGQIP
jgi:hypothetical protein